MNDEQVESMEDSPEDFEAKTLTDEWREEARIGMTVMKCFTDTQETLDDDNVHAAITAQALDYTKYLVNNPCCDDRSLGHMLKVVAQSCSLWAFQAGARSGNLTNISGLSHDPVPLVTDEEIEESRKRWVEEHRETHERAKKRVADVIEEMGLDRVEKDGIAGIVVKDTGQLRELLSRISGIGDEKEEASTGMYL